ncbi:hypothetical protein [Dongia deserti]|uniref:hypothetical protein n=1 Tax=Dongia deserti TaxID=2268030 RepID=UPI000E64FFAE|nr:hypothetical protein [Dongia deserti]
MRNGVDGVIQSKRLPRGGVRIELTTKMDRAAIELTPDAARQHALGVLKNLEPLSDTSAAALAAARAVDGGGNG